MDLHLNVSVPAALVHIPLLMLAMVGTYASVLTVAKATLTSLMDAKVTVNQLVFSPDPWTA